MSKSKIDSDGFQIVSKRFSRNKPTKIPNKGFKLEKQESKIDIVKSKQRIVFAIEDIQSSIFLEKLLQSVSTVCQSKNVVEIVCLGLGHIGECNISRYQLALLLTLKEKLKPENVYAHDPIFYQDECTILNNFDIKVIEENKEGKHLVSEEDLTLFYLPHCPKQLTNNFLWSNWGTQLQNCILICNSFTSLLENQPSRVVLESAPYINKIFPFTTEIAVENNFKFTDIFNDTSIHCFPIEKLKEVDKGFWDKNTKPEYTNSEEFITCEMIEKLTI